MNFGLVVPHLRMFGGVRRFLELHQWLEKAGHRAQIFTGEHSDTRWFDREVVPYGLRDLVDIPQAAEVEIWIVGDPPTFRVLNGITKPTYIYVIAGGVYTQQYLKLYNEQRPNVKFLLNNRVFQPSFPNARLCEGGVNTNVFRTWWEPNTSPSRVPRVGYYKGRGRIKGEDLIVKALATAPVQLIPLEGLTTYQLVNAYRDLSYFVCWEQRPGWANMAAEALACGCTVITNGVNVEPFIDRCIVLQDERALREFFTVSPMEDFSWENTTKRFLQILRDDGLPA